MCNFQKKIESKRNFDMHTYIYTFINKLAVSIFHDTACFLGDKKKIRFFFFFFYKYCNRTYTQTRVTRQTYKLFNGRGEEIVSLKNSIFFYTPSLINGLFLPPTPPPSYATVYF